MDVLSNDHSISTALNDGRMHIISQASSNADETLCKGGLHVHTFLSFFLDTKSNGALSTRR